MTITTPPYQAKIPRDDRPAGGWPTAEQELAAALEGQAPRLSKTIAAQLGPARTAELAQVVRRAVAVGIRRRAGQELHDRLEGAYDLLVDGLNQISECTTSEDEHEPTDLTEMGYTRRVCGSCGSDWPCAPVAQAREEADRG